VDVISYSAVTGDAIPFAVLISMLNQSVISWVGTSILEMHVADIITVEWNMVAAGYFRMWVTIKKTTQWPYNTENTLSKAPEYC
jgi:hypothetical protein